MIITPWYEVLPGFVCRPSVRLRGEHKGEGNTAIFCLFIPSHPIRQVTINQPLITHMITGLWSDKLLPACEDCPDVCQVDQLKRGRSYLFLASLSQLILVEVGLQQWQKLLMLMLTRPWSDKPCPGVQCQAAQEGGAIFAALSHQLILHLPYSNLHCGCLDLTAKLLLFALKCM